MHDDSSEFSESEGLTCRQLLVRQLALVASHPPEHHGIRSDVASAEVGSASWCSQVAEHYAARLSGDVGGDDILLMAPTSAQGYFPPQWLMTRWASAAGKVLDFGGADSVVPMRDAVFFKRRLRLVKDVHGFLVPVQDPITEVVAPTLVTPDKPSTLQWMSIILFARSISQLFMTFPSRDLYTALGEVLLEVFRVCGKEFDELIVSWQHRSEMASPAHEALVTLFDLPGLSRQCFGDLYDYVPWEVKLMGSVTSTQGITLSYPEVFIVFWVADPLGMQIPKRLAAKGQFCSLHGSWDSASHEPGVLIQHWNEDVIESILPWYCIPMVLNSVIREFARHGLEYFPEADYATTIARTCGSLLKMDLVYVEYLVVSHHLSASAGVHYYNVQQVGFGASYNLRNYEGFKSGHALEHCVLMFHGINLSSCVYRDSGNFQRSFCEFLQRRGQAPSFDAPPFHRDSPYPALPASSPLRVALLVVDSMFSPKIDELWTSIAGEVASYGDATSGLSDRTGRLFLQGCKVNKVDETAGRLRKSGYSVVIQWPHGAIEAPVTQGEFAEDESEHHVMSTHDMVMDLTFEFRAELRASFLRRTRFTRGAELRFGLPESFIFLDPDRNWRLVSADEVR